MVGREEGHGSREVGRHFVVEGGDVVVVVGLVGENALEVSGGRGLQG